MFELGYEAVGELDPRLEMFADWKEPNKEGVIYYLQNHRARGVLLWNIYEPGPLTRKNLKGRLK
jgi:hypothetical protein